jgi:hypothetical protein
MKKTIVTHFYNEEYLLPWWLTHHKKYFDHGVLINYASTDRSVEIIKDICPSWEIIDSVNKVFDAERIEAEVIDIEKRTEGWKLCLNTTEFIVGDFSILEQPSPQEYIMPCALMVDNEPDNVPLYTVPLVKQKYYGIFPTTVRRPRKIHCKQYESYPLGRHYDHEAVSTDKLKVLWYGYSPFTDEQIRRKLQIQNRIPEKDKQRGFGAEHLTTKEKLFAQYKDYLKQGRNISDE